MNLSNLKLAVIGLGYVGLPLAVEFSKKRNVVGFDIQKERIEELKSGFDKTFEVSNYELKKAKKINFTSNQDHLKNASCYIITVPTPINESKEPDLSFLINSSKAVGKYLKLNDIVIYESTVFPGCTEEICVPILEKVSGLKFNKEFFCGYSPERINPGDKEHRIDNIKKVISGSNSDVAIVIEKLYKEIVTAGTHITETIKEAEAAKVIENTQRDLNIALINELSIIFKKLDIDTEHVLKAAETKWNFLSFRPGLVGGHCISVDPYYLTYKAEVSGYKPQIILSGRKINDAMGGYIANNLITAMMQKGIKIKNSRVLIMGFTFKENCPDIRNSRVIDIVNELSEHKCIVDVYDPWVKKEDLAKKYNLNYVSIPKEGTYDSIVLAVGHNDFKKMGVKKIRSFGKSTNLIYDLKFLYNKNETDLRL